MHEKIKNFREYREKTDKAILEKDNLVIKRIYNLDTNAYKDGKVDLKTKEFIGLSTSLVLRCDDCVKYHLDQIHKLDVTTDELMEVLSIPNLVGGTIVIPHLRKAIEYWELLKVDI